MLLPCFEKWRLGHDGNGPPQPVCKLTGDPFPKMRPSLPCGFPWEICVDNGFPQALDLRASPSRTVVLNLD